MAPRKKNSEVSVAEVEEKEVVNETKKTTKKTKKVDEPTKAKTKKENKKEVVKEKPPVTEAYAIARNIRTTPRKVRLVIDLVRGKDVKVALGILANVNKAATSDVIKVIKSAAANATNNFQMDESRLYISEIYATDGLKMKRYLPRAKGSASGMVKRCSNITVKVKMR